MQDTVTFHNTAIALDRVCTYLEERNIPYSLAYGTLLGAVRHRGFIPHDGDVDLYLAKCYSHLVYDMAQHFGVETKYNTGKWNRQTSHQKLIFPGAFDIDFFNEDYPHCKDIYSDIKAFFELKNPELVKLAFCHRFFNCLSNYLDYLSSVYGADCLEYVDMTYRGEASYRDVARTAKIPLAEYPRPYRDFIQPNLAKLDSGPPDPDRPARSGETAQRTRRRTDSQETWNPQHSVFWPSPTQKRLLQAALLDNDQALRAWAAWRADHDPAAADPAAFFVFPHVYLNLKRLSVGESELAALRSVYLYTRMKNQQAIQSVAEVLHLFAQLGISAMVLKGTPLLLYHYQDLGARLMNDTDLLIHDTALPAAASALRDAGWELEKPIPTPYLTPIVRAVHSFRAERSLLDLHWRPFTIDCPQPAEQQVWLRAAVRDVQGAMAYVPDLIDQLLLVCLHSRKLDPQAACRWIVDAMSLITTSEPPINWHALFDRACETRLVLPVRDALTYLHQEFNAPVPGDFLAQIRDVPTVKDDVMRYRELMTENRHFRSLRDALRTHWWRYSILNRHHAQKPGLIKFCQYYLAFKQWDEGGGNSWQVTLNAARKVANRMTGRL